LLAAPPMPKPSRLPILNHLRPGEPPNRKQAGPDRTFCGKFSCYPEYQNREARNSGDKLDVEICNAIPMFVGTTAPMVSPRALQNRGKEFWNWLISARPTDE
jgi:hypothetical protein